MTRYLYAFLALLCASSVFSQEIIVADSEEYHRVKANGQLEDYVFESSAMPDLQDTKYASNRMGGGDDTPCDCWLEPDETYTLAMSPNDDASSSLIDLEFDYCLYGEDFGNVYINNNGNISFGSPYGTFTAEGFPSSNYVMVAPFWGDVDTRPANGGEVWYKVTESALYVNWVAVGYYSMETDKLNTFQVIITNGNDGVIPDGNNVSFCYKSMEWTTGAASQGVNGFGGSPATVGANLGNGVDFVQFGTFDEPGGAYDGPFNEPDGIDWLDNKYFVFSTCVDGNNVAPFAPSSGVCDTLQVCQGGAVLAQFLGPEEDQMIDIEFTIDGGTGVSVSQTQELGSTDVFIFADEDAAPGFYQITITATDDGSPALSTTILYFVEVIEDSTPPISISGPDGICPGDPAVLSVEDVYDSYSWSTGGTDPEITVNSPGTYSITSTTDICLKFDEFELLPYPVPEPEIEGEILICSNAETTLSVDDIYESYIWNNDSQLNTNEIIVGLGTYSIVVENEFGCEGGASINVDVLPSPTLNNATSCELEHEFSGSNPNFTGTWETSSSDGSATFNPDDAINTAVSVSNYGSYDFTFTDECGISVESTVEFYPVVDFEIADGEFCIGSGPTVVQPIGAYPEFYDWFWYNDSTSNPTDVYVGPGFYSFQASNICHTSTSSATYTEIPCEVIIYNVFTPGVSSGENDSFDVKGSESYLGSTMKIFNRWGTLIYEITNSNSTPILRWDGEDYPEGTYYYTIELNGTDILLIVNDEPASSSGVIHGTFTMLR